MTNGPTKRKIRKKRTTTLDLFRAARDEFGEVQHRIVLGLFVELLLVGIHDDRGIHRIFYPLWTTLHIQCHIPVYPTDCTLLQVLPEET